MKRNLQILISLNLPLIDNLNFVTQNPSCTTLLPTKRDSIHHPLTLNQKTIAIAKSSTLHPTSTISTNLIRHLLAEMPSIPLHKQIKAPMTLIIIQALTPCSTHLTPHTITNEQRFFRTISSHNHYTIPNLSIHFSNSLAHVYALQQLKPFPYPCHRHSNQSHPYCHNEYWISNHYRPLHRYNKSYNSSLRQARLHQIDNAHSRWLLRPLHPKFNLKPDRCGYMIFFKTKSDLA